MTATDIKTSNLNAQTDAPTDPNLNAQADAPWRRFSQDRLVAAWRDATNELPGYYSRQTCNFSQLRAESPNVLVVYFPQTLLFAKTICEEGKVQIAERLAPRLGGPVSLRFALDDSKGRAPIAPQTSPVPARSNFSPGAPASFGANTANHSNTANRPNTANTPTNPNVRNERSGVLSARPNLQTLRRDIESSEIVSEIKELFDANLAEVKPPLPSRQ